MCAIRKIIALALAALLVAQCTSPIALPLQRQATPPRPTIGPVRQVAGSSITFAVELKASTNCAEVGEVITFTTQITNETTVPITLTGSPLLEIVLKPAGPTGPTQRWSQTNQYPQVINPVLAPHEVRSYQWQWVADAVYAQQQRLDYNGVWARLILGDTFIGGYTVPVPGGSMEVYVGVGSVALARYGSGIRCADMQH